MSKNDGEVELPPLPDRFDSVSVDDFTGQRLSVYTASQMEAYARAAIAARTCPLPAHWRRAIEEWEGRMLPSPRKLKQICDLIEQRARQMAKGGLVMCPDVFTEGAKPKFRWDGSLYANVQRLVASDGEIVAVVRYAYKKGWRLGDKHYIDAESARAAAEKKAGGDRG